MTTPILSDTNVTMNPGTEDDGAPVGVVGTLVSDLINAGNVADPDPGTAGIAISAFDTSQGSWFYSINGGASWLAVQQMVIDAGYTLDLSASDLLYFQPNPDFNGTLANAITFRAWDGSDSVVPGNYGDPANDPGAYSSASDTASLTIAAVNDAPFGADKTITSGEDSRYVFSLADFGFSDPADNDLQEGILLQSLPAHGLLGIDSDGPGGSAPVPLAANAHIARSFIEGGSLVFVPDAEWSGSDGFTFKVTDTGAAATGPTTSASANTITFNITPVNDNPLLNPDGGSPHGLDELAGTINSSAPQSVSATFTFTDIETTDTHFATVGLPTILWSGGATLPSGVEAALIAAASVDPAVESNGSGSFVFHFQLQDKQLDFLASGESLSIIFPVIVHDNHGGAYQQVATININGSNDAPGITVIGSDDITPDLTETNAGQHLVGTLTATDYDKTDVVTATVTSVIASGKTVGLVPDTATLQSMLTFATSDADYNTTSNLTYTFDSGSEAFNYLAENETLALKYAVHTSDGHGGIFDVLLTATITGTNDGPTIAAADVVTGTVTEDSGSYTVNGNFKISDLDLSDSHTAIQHNLVISGSPTAPAALLGGLGSFSILPITENTTDADGTAFVNWSFNVDNATVQGLGVGETVTQDYTVRVSDGHGGTVDQHVLVTLQGQNDGPTLTVGGGDLSGMPLTEGNSGLVATGTLTAVDPDISDTLTASASLFTKNGAVAGLAVSDADLQAMMSVALLGDNPGSHNNLTWTFDSGSEAFNYLAASQTLVLTYTVTVDDSHGSTASTIVDIVITGTNDGPAITIGGSDSAALGLTEGNGALTGSATLTAIDPDQTDSLATSVVLKSKTGTLAGLGSSDTALAGMLTVPTPIAGDPGSSGNLTWTFNSDPEAFNYLGGGQQLVLTYTITVDDSHGSTATRDVVVTIDGANDAPVITVGGSDSDALLRTEGNGGLTGSGSLTVIDGDVTDTVTASVTGLVKGGTTLGIVPDDAALQGMLTVTSGPIAADAGASGNIGWTFNSGNEAFNFLDENETLTLTYTITVDDGHGGTDTQDVTVTINGTNDRPTISFASGDTGVIGLDETDGTITGSGTLGVTDPDYSDAVTASVVGVSKTGTLAGLVIDDAQLLSMLTTTAGSIAANPGDVHNLGWTFNSGGQAFDYLDDGETLNLFYTIQVTDDSGATAQQQVLVIVTGTNDVPTIGLVSTSDSDTAAFSDGNDPLVAQGTLTVVDPDMSDSVDVAIVSVTGNPALPNQNLLSLLSLGQSHLDADPIPPGAPVRPGQLGWIFTAGGAQFDYLGAGETQQLTYVIRVTDDSGATADHSVVITIAGTNEAPVLLGSTPASTALVEIADHGPGENSATLASSGVLHFSDSDAHDSHGITVAPQGGNYLGSLVFGAPNEAGGTVGWTFSVDDHALDALAGGEVVHQLYTVTISDGHGGSASQVIAVDLIGTNDAAILSSANVVLVQGLDPVAASGTLTISDVDNAATFQAQTGVQGSYGQFSITSAGQWSYAANAAYQNLAPGSVLTETFAVLAADGTETSVTVSIAGSADVSVARPDTFVIAESGQLAGSLFGDNGAGPDASPNNSLQVASINGVAANVGHGLLLASGAQILVNADGTFSYDPNHAFDWLTSAAGSANAIGHDSFTYTLAGGSTATVFVNIVGEASPGDRILGGAFDDTVSGFATADTFMLNQGGHDSASGLGGNDGFYFGAAYDAGDSVDGGDGTDTLALQGNIAATLGTIANVEVILAMSGSDTRFGDSAGNRYDYDLTTTDANVGAGKTLTVQATGLLQGEDLRFDGSAETDGNFRVFAGQGADTLIGGHGHDGFFFGSDGNFTAADHVEGGAGTDTIALRGNYVGANAVVFQDGSFSGIEVVSLLSSHTNEFSGQIVATGFDYDVTMADGNVGAGQLLDVNAARLGSDESVRFDGHLETNGAFRILSGAGDDTLTGGAGGDLIYGGLGKDRLEGGAGADLYLYRSAAESTSTGYDTIVGFDWHQDRIDAPGGTRAFSQAGTGALSTASFDADLAAGLNGVLGAGQAALYTVTSGTLSGHVFAVVDANGVAGYQAGEDLVIELANPVTPIDPTAAIIL